MATSMDSSIVLIINQGDSNSSGDEDLVQEVEGGMLAYEDWESLVAMAYHAAEIRIRVDRDVLSNHSTYFRSYRNFREAEWEIVRIEFYQPIFCSLLQCIHGYQPSLSSSTIAPLIQRSEVACLKAVYINRCKSDKHAFHRVSGAGSAEASSQYYGRIHKDTKVLEWNSIQLKQSVVNERLTFD